MDVDRLRDRLEKSGDHNPFRGWTCAKHSRGQRGGKLTGDYYTYQSPCGRKFRSVAEVQRFLCAVDSEEGQYEEEEEHEDAEERELEEQQTEAPHFEVQRILGVRYTHKGLREYAVRWKDCRVATQDTWERADSIIDQSLIAEFEGAALRAPFRTATYLVDEVLATRTNGGSLQSKVSWAGFPAWSSWVEDSALERRGDRLLLCAPTARSQKRQRTQRAAVPTSGPELGPRQRAARGANSLPPGWRRVTDFKKTKGYAGPRGSHSKSSTIDGAWDLFNRTRVLLSDGEGVGEQDDVVDGDDSPRTSAPVGVGQEDDVPVGVVKLESGESRESGLAGRTRLCNDSTQGVGGDSVSPAVTFAPPPAATDSAPVGTEEPPPSPERWPGVEDDSDDDTDYEEALASRAKVGAEANVAESAGSKATAVMLQDEAGADGSVGEGEAPQWLVIAEQLLKNGKLSIRRAARAIEHAAGGLPNQVDMYRLLEDERDLDEQRVFGVMEELGLR